MVDITCPSCDIIYHADETHIGRGFRCKVCGKILRVERHGTGPSLAQAVVQSTVGKQRRSRGRWIGVGILLGGAIFLGLLRFYPDLSQYLNRTAPTTTEIAPTTSHSATQPTQRTAGTTASVPAATNPAEAKQWEIVAQDSGLLGDSELNNNYREVNGRYYGSRLPAIPVLWEPRLEEVGRLKAEGLVQKGLWAKYGDKVFILLNPETRVKPRELRRVLCHEIVHEYLFTLGDTKTNHGTAFKRDLHRLAEAGAFEGISASEDERASLRSWIDGESARLEGESEGVKWERNELDRMREEIDRERASLDQKLRDLNQRISIGNAQGYGWPSDDEIESSKAKDRLLDQSVDDFNGRVADFKARVAKYNSDVTRFNRYVKRFNLMMAYPDGLDEESEIQPKSTVDQSR